MAENFQTASLEGVANPVIYRVVKTSFIGMGQYHACFNFLLLQIQSSLGFL